MRPHTTFCLLSSPMLSARAGAGSRATLALGLTLLLAPAAGCGGAAPDADPTAATAATAAVPTAGEGNAPRAESLGAAFSAAAAEFGVPQDLLVAIAQTETGLYFVPGLAGDAYEGQPAYGVMALRGERLVRAARLAGTSVQAVQTAARDNIRAAAALLRAEADALPTANQGLATLPDWATAVARYSGLPTAATQAEYVNNGVYAVLRSGLPDETARRHGLSLAGRTDLPDELIAPPGGGLDPQRLDYRGATWQPAPASNFTNGRSMSIELLVIHTCAGAWSGCWGWLTTPYPTNPNKTSAHYVVKEDGKLVYQLVEENDTAHHVGKPWKGLSTNARSVGIEHAGFSYQGTNKWTEGQVAASAALSCDIVKRNRIIQDRDHIIGHYQPDPVNRSDDPGTNFPWADYMTRIAGCVGGAPTGIIVDTNQANNGASARFDTPSASWISSTNVAGYWGTGYYVAPSQAVADAATFNFELKTAGSKEVFAWWTAASDRTTAAPFVIFDADGTKLATVNQNQQINGGKWVSLGTYNFKAGWSQVAVSRWTSATGQVVADAIRVE